jgi:hypothetical protein
MFDNHVEGSHFTFEELAFTAAGLFNAFEKHRADWAASLA